MIIEVFAVTAVIVTIGAVYRRYRLESYKYYPPRHTRACVKNMLKQECSGELPERPPEAERLEAIFS